jgi:tungstate transport system permease protein
MYDVLRALAEARRLIATGDEDLYAIVVLSLQVSASSAALAAAVGLPLGAWLAIARFRGHGLAVASLNALLGLPSVVVGLIAYLMLSRSGPLGYLGLLFTPGAMVFAQTLLISPMVASLARQQLGGAWDEYRDQMASMRVPTSRAVATLIYDCRFALLTIVLAAFGRAIAEVGAVMTVGGNIAGSTRVMTTAIALETSKGDLPLALGLGIVLLATVLAVTLAAQAISTAAQRRHG